MKYILTLHDRKYEVEVELSEPILMEEFNACAPVPATVPVKTEETPNAAVPAVPVIAGEGEHVDAPMPGNILKVNVTSGQIVKEGDVLLILEAMKMENEIMAPKGGTVTKVLVEKGANVETGAPLVFIK